MKHTHVAAQQQVRKQEITPKRANLYRSPVFIKGIFKKNQRNEEDVPEENSGSSKQKVKLASENGQQRIATWIPNDRPKHHSESNV